MTVDVLIDCPAWTADLPEAAAVAERAVRAAAAEAFVRPGRFEVSLLLTDDEGQRALNRDWRGQDRPTNVLAFPGQAPEALAAPPGDGPALGLGDISLAHGTVRDEAREQGKSLDAHLSHLVVHGFLHLVGHDHGEAAEAERMEALETAVLLRLGIADPYADAAVPAGEQG
jgi:probable rRNA maturation factor